ncbi:MAG TPA: hypothetical protein VHT03_03555 [Rhizomicrobium sp.]|jgi:hypothetical protein|nr:hypothetical protein [Rhizomicrobium sp.]
MAQSPTADGPGLRRGIPGLAAVLALLAVGVLAGLGRTLLIARLHVPLDPNEGWNAYHAGAALAGNPYPPPGSFLVNNYPPLSFYLIGIIGSWCGDNVVAGRLVSLGAFATLCLFIAIALRRMNARWSAALLAPLLLAAMLLLASDYVGMDDPQLLGHALQFSGLLLLLRRSPETARILGSAAFFVTGAFVKHNLLALPLASLAWLMLVDRRNAVRFAAALLALSLAGFVVTYVLLGVNLFGVLNSPRTFSAAQLASDFVDWLPMMAVPLGGLVWLLLRFGKDQAVWLVSLYALVSIATGTILFGGAGVDVNAMFDADIALSLCAGLAVSRSLDYRTPSSRTAAQLFSVLCIVPLAIAVLRSPDWRDRSFWLRPMEEETATAGRDIVFLRTHWGPAMCEDLTFCYWAGKAAVVDVFNLTQEFETGARDAGPFLRLIQSHYFASIELDETNPLPFPSKVEATILRNYRIDHRDDEGIFFIPRL